jgi:hypothetical protein
MDSDLVPEEAFDEYKQNELKSSSNAVEIIIGEKRPQLSFQGEKHVSGK